MRTLVVVFLFVSQVLGAGLFGDLNDFNLATLDPNYSLSCSSSDVRGRVASRGNTVLVNYNIACQIGLSSNPTMNDQCPSWGNVTCTSLGYSQGDLRSFGLIAASAVQATQTGSSLKFIQGEISGGVAYGLSQGFQATTLPDCTTNVWSSDQTPARWDSIATQLSTLSASIQARATTGTTNVATYASGNQIQFVGSGVNDFETFFVNGDAISAANVLQGISNTKAATIFINVNGTNVTLVGGVDASIKAVTAKIVWNFYEATTLQIVNGFWGSILAPSANVVNAGGAIWGQIFVNSFVSGSADFWNPSHCAQINWVPFTGLVPPSAGRCGDGNVDAEEQCDSGSNNGSPSSCCTLSCTFSPSTQICRPVAGDCDVPETCSGSSASCPTDGFKNSSQPCSHTFGICDVAISYRCPGTGSQCIQKAPAPLFQWDAFNVISFNSYTCNGGDVEGALAVKNWALLNNYDVGLKLSNRDAYTLFSLVSAGNITYTNGQIHPDAGSLWQATDDKNRTYSKPWGYVGAGQNFFASDYLKSSQLQNVYLTTSQFDLAQQYYAKISNLLSALPVSAVSSVIYGDGLQITCQNASDLYHVKVDGDLLSSTNWYVLAGCSWDASFIIDVTGINDITIKGAPFPGIVERVIYNVLGTNRAIYGTNGVNGNILAPFNAYSQHNGVTYGRVIVGDVFEARQNNKPNCTNFELITISNAIMKPIKMGDTMIYVVDVSNYNQGDQVCVGASCVEVVSGIVVDVPDTPQQNIIVIGEPFPNDVAIPQLLSTPVNPNTSTRNQPIPVTHRTSVPDIDFGDSSGSVLTPIALLMAASLFF